MARCEKETYMSNVRLVLAIALVAALLLPVLANAEDGMTKDEACKILGNCADDAVATAQKMRAQCQEMMKAAEKMIDKGARIMTRGQMWTDKEMETEGNSLVAQGKLMLHQAKMMDQQCKIIIDSAKKSKDKAKKMASSQDGDKNPVKGGDHSPD